MDEIYGEKEDGNMSSWAEVDSFNQMIEALSVFQAKVNESSAVIGSAVQTCVDNMENDKASLSAAKNVAASRVKYQEATELAANLAKALAEKRDEIVEYLRLVEEMDD